MGELETSIQYLGGVGPKRAELLGKELGISTISDLVHLYPFRYIDRSGITRICDVTADLTNVQIKARVVQKTLYGQGSAVIPQDRDIKFNTCRRLSVLVSDGSGQMEMVFFKGIKWNFARLAVGTEFVFFGKPQSFGSRINMVHPEVDNASAGAPMQSSLTGVYPSTDRLRDSGITGKLMCRMQSNALSLCLDEIKETLPSYIIQEKGLVSLRTAIHDIHFPRSAESLQKAVRRLKFEELFLLQLSLLKQRFVRSRDAVGIRMPRVGDAFNACYRALPYSLTGAQQRVIKEIRGDLLSGHQMNRLLQGDVGSGKTMVAVLSCLLAVDNGCQACIMAPTEVLATQHAANIAKYLAPTGVKSALLTGSTPAKQRAEIHRGLEDGSLGIIIGTHALIEDNVVFHNLGLAVIDEQHRFGVDQRAKLWGKNSPAPHILVMTATPIPRTLAMTLYGDLDVSVIDEMPPGRKPVQTVCIGESKRRTMYKFIRKEIAAGRQAFIVYPLIFESEKLDLKNLEKGYEEVAEVFPLPDYYVAIVHGQQTAEEKAQNMAAFVSGKANILVSTTVIEVGVDVPNASVMVIESAQRFGLSQLHQLRGRVGRGADNAYCILVKDPKTSKEAQKRLDLMCATEDGFEIAEEDMKMRGPGDLEGTAQSGLPVSLTIASLAKDGMLLSEARDYAERILEEDPHLSSPKNALLAAELRKGKYDLKDYSRIS